jgi:hypothetical protein
VIGKKSGMVISSRYVLPQNIDAAIKQLDDQALDIAVHRLGPNGAFGWVARLGEDHGSMEYRSRSLALSAML